MGAKAVVVVVVVVVVAALLLVMGVDAQQFDVVHSYAHHEGSPVRSGGQGESEEYSAILKAHDRRRLASVADFPLSGDDDPYSIGLYFTTISLGTPPRDFHVQVDTGSDILWLNCNPCPGCPLVTDIPGITLEHYDPSLSSSDQALGCRDAACEEASMNAGNGACTAVGNTQACSYITTYGDGSSTQGYFINDILTFKTAESANATATANVYFGCGTTQAGNLLTTSRALDGLMGFGQAQISLPTQLASQAKVGRVFAHCLQGDNQGGGTFVIGNILETGISYTPIIPKQFHYSVGMENIAVQGVNITTPASFALGTAVDGVIMDSGTTLSYLSASVYNDFTAAISSGAPVPATQLKDGGGGSSLCWIYDGNITTAFPAVTLFFAGGVAMNLKPKNYLYSSRLTVNLQTSIGLVCVKYLSSERLKYNNGSRALSLILNDGIWFQGGGVAYCMGWMSSASTYIIFGDNVLKDHLVVYDNEKQRVGWKPFDCTQPISVSAPNSTTPMDILPGDGFSVGATTRVSTIVSSACLALSAVLCTLL